MTESFFYKCEKNTSKLPIAIIVAVEIHSVLLLDDGEENKWYSTSSSEDFQYPAQEKEMQGLVLLYILSLKQSESIYVTLYIYIYIYQSDLYLCIFKIIIVTHNIIWCTFRGRKDSFLVVGPSVLHKYVVIQCL